MDTDSLPLVSIVMPTYNGEKYLKEAIASCLHQTYGNIELIIVDDGSTGITSSIVSEFDDPRIRYLKLNTNTGAANALNKGFKISRGQYLSWISDDDLYELTAIEKMADSLMNNRRIDFVYANYYKVDKENNVIQTVNVEEPINLRERNCIGPCVMYKSDVYETVGDFRSEFWLAEEYEYWIKIYRNRFKMVPLNEFLFRYRVHQEGKTGKFGVDMEERQAIEIRNRYFKKFRLKKFFISQGNILIGKFIWRIRWLKRSIPWPTYRNFEK